MKHVGVNKDKKKEMKSKKEKKKKMSPQGDVA
jgi:hypothetical protein